MIAEPPSVVVIAGPNGAGKSTAAPALLGDLLAISDFVNADVIARGLSAFEPERAAMQAGRVMLARLKELAAARQSFAFETTLASKTFAPWIAGLLRQGYEFHLVYLYLNSPQMAVERVAGRVRAGGHHVAPDVVGRRYFGGLRNFFRLYRPLATTWKFLNNSGPGATRIIASGRGSSDESVGDEGLWRSIKELAT